MFNIVAISVPGGLEWVAIALVGLLIFGRRLPEVARSIGRSILEFKRGLKDVQDDVNVSATPKDPHRLPPEQHGE